MQTSELPIIGKCSTRVCKQIQVISSFCRPFASLRRSDAVTLIWHKIARPGLLAGVLGVVLSLLVTVGPPTALAQDDAPEDSITPIAVINVASFERLLESGDLLFEAADRPELSESLSGVLGRVNDLKGLDRNRSMGLLIFLDGIIPSVVAFVPVEKVEDLVETAGKATMTVSELRPNQYALKGSRDTQNRLFARVQGGYAFIGNTEDGLKKIYPDPKQLTSRLSRDYDIAASLNFRAVPQASRELLMSFFKTTADIANQRRDDEAEGAWKFRKAQSENQMDGLQQLLTQGEEFTIGWRLDPVSKEGTLEFLVVATAGSDYAFALNQLKSMRSMFANMVAAPAPATISMTSHIDKQGKIFFSKIVKIAEAELLGENDAPTQNDKKKAKAAGTALPQRKQRAGDDHPIRIIASVLQATIDSEKIDAAVQIQGAAPGPYALVAGLRVSDGDRLATAAADLLNRYSEKNDLVEIELNAAAHRGVRFHKLSAKKADANVQRFVGGPAIAHIGCAGNTLWFCVGGVDAFDQLKKSMDLQASPTSDSTTSLPIYASFDIATWVTAFGPTDDTGDKSAYELNRFDRNSLPKDQEERTKAFREYGQTEQRNFGRRFRDQIKKGAGLVTLEYYPIDDGGRVIFRFNQAFLRFVGGEIARSFDANAAQPETTPPATPPAAATPAN